MFWYTRTRFSFMWFIVTLVVGRFTKGNTSELTTMDFSDGEIVGVADNISDTATLTGEVGHGPTIPTVTGSLAPEPVCSANVGAMLISHCPPDHWRFPRERCEGPMTSTRSKYSVNYMFPVSSASGHHYKNRHCLDCWEPNAPVQVWRMNVSQSHWATIGTHTNDIGEILKYVNENPALVTWIPPDVVSWPACPDLDPEDKTCHVCGELSPSEEAMCTLVSKSTSMYGETIPCHICRRNTTEIEANRCTPPEVELDTFSVTRLGGMLNTDDMSMPSVLFEYHSYSLFSWTTKECDALNICRDTACRYGVYIVDGVCNGYYVSGAVKVKICSQDKFSISGECTSSDSDALFLPLRTFYEERQQSESKFILIEPDLKIEERGKQNSLATQESGDNVTWIAEDMIPNGFLSDLETLFRESVNQSAKMNTQLSPLVRMATNLTKEGKELRMEITHLSDRRSYVNWAQVNAAFHSRLALLLAEIGVHGRLAVCMISRGEGNYNEIWDCTPLFICPGAWGRWPTSSAPLATWRVTVSQVMCMVMAAGAALWIPLR